MLFLTYLFSFPLILLILHCLYIFTFNNWLGPLGTFYGSVFIFTLVIGLNLNELYFILLNGNYWFVDFGRWFFCFNVIDSHLLFCIDSLALVCSTLVMLLTILALYFGVEYMYREAFINSLLYLLNLFSTSVVLLFVSYDFFVIIVAWECIGLFSLLLVNFYSTSVYTLKATLNTFIFSRLSDMFMFLAFITTLVSFNTTDLSLIFLQTPFFATHFLFFNNYAIHFLTFLTMMLMLSGMINAAQFFFHVWLPDAMEAPTPASALIHSSTLVVAGIYVIISFSVMFEFALTTNYFLIYLGGFTLAFGAITAVFQTDINNLVAYSTISQIGYLSCGCGFCCYEEVLLYLIIHAVNNAFLFILVGYIVHFFNGNTDLRLMGGIYLYSFDIAVFLYSTALNLAGLPYSAGFLGNEFLLFQVMRDDILSLWVRSCWLVSFFFTPIYMLILTFIVTFGPNNSYTGTYNTVSNYTNKFSYVNTITQYTLVTARTTSLILFTFWNFFFWSGDFLISLLFDFTSLTSTTPSNNFFCINTHTPFLLNTNSSNLLFFINFFIIFLSITALIYLVSLKLVSTRVYFTTTYFLLMLSFSVVVVFLYLNTVDMWYVMCKYFTANITFILFFNFESQISDYCTNISNLIRNILTVLYSANRR